MKKTALKTKKFLPKLYILVFLLATGFIMFAQGPGTDDPDGGQEDPDPPAPISTQLIALAVAGASFAFYYHSNKKKKVAENN